MSRRQAGQGLGYLADDAAERAPHERGLRNPGFVHAARGDHVFEDCAKDQYERRDGENNPRAGRAGQPRPHEDRAADEGRGGPDLDDGADDSQEDNNADDNGSEDTHGGHGSGSVFGRSARAASLRPPHDGGTRPWPGSRSLLDARLGTLVPLRRRVLRETDECSVCFPPDDCIRHIVPAARGFRAVHGLLGDRRYPFRDPRDG